jgi:uncharacterized protein YbjT (DUF2867 family)
MRILVAGGTGTSGLVIVRRAAEAGHTVRVLSRTADRMPDVLGVEHVAGDLRTGAGLAEAVGGMDVVIDVSNVATPFYRPAARFFVEATQQLVAAERRVGVAHHLVLSIAGVDRVDSGYYRAKVDQERVAYRETERAGIGCTVARVSQFHDFAALIFHSYRLGPVVLVPALHLQPVHLDDVAEHLLTLAGGPPGRARDLIGPQPEELPDMMERYAATQPGRVRLVRLPLPAGYRRANEAGALKPADSLRGHKTYAEWLAEISS